MRGGPPCTAPPMRPAHEAWRRTAGAAGRVSEERKLAGELRHGVPVERGLRRAQLRLPARARTGHEFPAPPRTRRVVPSEPSGDDGDLATALGAVSAA